MECLANPQFSEHWGAHRAIINWIAEFTTTMRDNLLYLANAQLQPPSPTSTEPAGTPFMQHTADFDEDDFPIPDGQAHL